MTESDRERPTDNTEQELVSFLALVVAEMFPQLSCGARDQLRNLRRKMLREAQQARDECLR